MKEIVFLFLIIFVTNTKAQIVFEHQYDTASSFPYLNSQLLIVNFEVSGYQYVKINRVAKDISIYNMSHSLVQTISLASFPMDGNGVMGDVLYLSQNLFNTDPLIEFMYVYSYGSAPTHGSTMIINQNGSVLFSDTGAPSIHVNFALQQYPIYNTPNGTKMILSYYYGPAKVFNLGGTLTTAIDRTSHSLTGNMGNAYPNPTASTTTIPYTLPQGINQGEIVFYNTQGIEVKRFKVDNTFSSLLISTTDIPAGTYYYNLQTAANASGAKKVVVVK
jgi:hypothetical protein